MKRVAAKLFHSSHRLAGIAAAVALALGIQGVAQAEETKVTIAISGWTGFAPLTLAKEAGLFKKQGLDVTIKKIPQKDRHLAIASGDVQCVPRRRLKPGWHGMQMASPRPRSFSSTRALAPMGWS